MKLSIYLESRGESQSSFAKRSRVAQRVVNRICRGEASCTAPTALQIIQASLAEPGPNGETVSLEGLASAVGEIHTTALEN